MGQERGSAEMLKVRPNKILTPYPLMTVKPILVRMRILPAAFHNKTSSYGFRHLKHHSRHSRHRPRKTRLHFQMFSMHSNHNFNRDNNNLSKHNFLNNHNQFNHHKAFKEVPHPISKRQLYQPGLVLAEACLTRLSTESTVDTEKRHRESRVGHNHNHDQHQQTLSVTQP